MSQAGAFASFLERDAAREKRRRARRRTIIISIALHAVALALLVVWSFWDIDELWRPSVQVRMFTGAQAPPGVSSRPEPVLAPPLPAKP